MKSKKSKLHYVWAIPIPSFYKNNMKNVDLIAIFIIFFII